MKNLNLEFSDNILRVMRLDDNAEILSKNEVSLSFGPSDYDQMKKNTHDFTREFSEGLRSALNEDLIETVMSGVLIGTEQTFLNVFPVDFNDDQSNINSHILWELSNYFPDTCKDFNIRYFRLNNTYQDQSIDEALLIAVNNRIIDFIKILCNESNIKIKNLEIDQFAVERSLKKIHPDDVKEEVILLIGCKNSRLDFSLLSKGDLVSYDFEVIENRNFKNPFIRQISYLNSGFSNVEKIFLYGDRNSQQVKDLIREVTPEIPVTFISKSEDPEDVKFSPLYGLSLKNINLR